MDLTAARVDHALVREPSRDGLGPARGGPPGGTGVARAGGAAARRLGVRPPAGLGAPPRTASTSVPSWSDGRVDWLKIDLVTDLSFGRWHELTTRIAGPLPGRARPHRSRPPRPGGRAARPAAARRCSTAGASAPRAGPGWSTLEPLAAPARRRSPPGPRPRTPGWPTWDAITEAIRARGLAHDRVDGRTARTRGWPRAGPARSPSGGRANRAARRSVKALTALAGRGPARGPRRTRRHRQEHARRRCGRLDRRAGPRALRRHLPRRHPHLAAARRQPPSGSAAASSPPAPRSPWHRARGRLVILDRHPVEARPAPGDALSAPGPGVRRHAAVGHARPARPPDRARRAGRRCSTSGAPSTTSTTSIVTAAATSSWRPAPTGARCSMPLPPRTRSAAARSRLVWERVVAGHPLPATPVTGRRSDPARDGIGGVSRRHADASTRPAGRRGHPRRSAARACSCSGGSSRWWSTWACRSCWSAACRRPTTASSPTPCPW